MLLGLDCLGLAKFPSSAIKAIPAGLALGVFANTFGDSYDAVSHVIGRCKALRVQLYWSDNNHSFPNPDKNTLKNEAARWAKLASNHGVPLYISPFCEHNLAEPDPYLDAVKDGAPDCEPVNSILKGALSKKYINEVHGTKVKSPGGKYVFSYDGSDIFGSRVHDIKTRHKSAVIWFAWTSRFNGHKTAKDKSDHSSWASDKTIKSVIYLMKHEKGITRVPLRTTWISHSRAVLRSL